MVSWKSFATNLTTASSAHCMIHSGLTVAALVLLPEFKWINSSSWNIVSLENHMGYCLVFFILD
jgi:hypothetical protein